MKISLSVAALATIAVMSAPAQAAGNICISTRNIVSSTPQQDGAAIVFKMRDGAVWRNDLQGRCPDLKFNGFAWVILNPWRDGVRARADLAGAAVGRNLHLGQVHPDCAAARPQSLCKGAGLLVPDVVARAHGLSARSARRSWSGTKMRRAIVELQTRSGRHEDLAGKTSPEAFADRPHGEESGDKVELL